jgi:hypothetical protein
MNYLQTSEVIDRLRDRVHAVGSIVMFAKEAGFSAPYIGDVLRGARPPSAKVCELLGVQKLVLYREVGP